MRNALIRMVRGRLVGALIPALVVLLWAGIGSAVADSRRVVAIGDIHGDYDALVAILKEAGVIDAARRWNDPNTTLVQTGDFLDRGPRMREVTELLMTLEKQAARKGGQVIVLLGNHEVMNLLGDLRYVTQENFAEFAGRKAEKRQRSAYQAYLKFRAAPARAGSEATSAHNPAAEQEWMEAHPPGFIEHREVFGPAGRYGRWLRERSSVARIGDVVFLHGGISPDFASLNIETINQRIRDEIRAFDAVKGYLEQRKLILPFFTLGEMVAAVQSELETRKAELQLRTAEAAQAGKTYVPAAEEKRHLELLDDFLGLASWLSIRADGPLWFRGYAEWPEETGASQIASVLGSYAAAHFVVGHTPQRNGRIQPRFGGKVFLIDTGMLASFYPGGRPAALEIRDGRFTAIYLDQRVVLLDRSSGATPASGPALSGVMASHGTGPTEIRQETSPASSAARPARVWLDPDGNPLPFTSDEEVMEFLRTAKVVRIREIGQGITRPKRVLLEQGGIRMNAAFRDLNEEKTVAQFVTGRTEVGFRDSYLFEPAAYELSRLLGLDNVPPAIVRRIGGKSGSLQIWVEQAMTEGNRKQRGLQPPDPEHWNQQMYIMHHFDRLIYNTDRNLGNVLIDPNWKAWMIDHTRAFRLQSDITDADKIVKCERTFLEKLKTLDEATLKQRLKPYLRSSEITALFKRARKLVELVEKLIQERGEENVLYALKSREPAHAPVQ